MKNNKKKDENRNKVIISITIVALIIALVSGGTYAWWTWISADEDDTAVNITVKGMTMILDGGGNITAQNLVPTSCTSTTYAVQRTITYSVTNPTTIAATATIQLQPTTLPTQLKNAKVMWKLTTAANCGGTQVGNGTFSSASTSTPIDLTTVAVPANTTTALTGTYYLSIWLDSTYTGTTNVGDTVNDTIQDKSMTLELTGEIAQNAS